MNWENVGEDDCGNPHPGRDSPGRFRIWALWPIMPETGGFTACVQIQQVHRATKGGESIMVGSLGERHILIFDSCYGD